MSAYWHLSVLTYLLTYLLCVTANCILRYSTKKVDEEQNIVLGIKRATFTLTTTSTIVEILL